MDNVKDKIRKLLAKATSQNEYEAQAALLKARELMAKHKIDEKEVCDAPSANREVKRVKFTEETHSARKNGYFGALAQLIAENHCCANVTTIVQGSTLRTVTFVGVGDDADLALEVFTYAVHHIKDVVKAQRKKINAYYRWQDDRNAAVKSFEYSYAEGFIVGLRKQYDEQFKMMPDNETMAIVMATPVEVKEYLGTLKKRNLRINGCDRNNDAYSAGYNAGYRFSPVKQIGGETAAV